MNRSWYGDRRRRRPALRCGPSRRIRPAARRCPRRARRGATTSRHRRRPHDPQHPAVQHQSRVQSHHFDVRLPKLTTEGADSATRTTWIPLVDFLGQHPPTLAEIVLTQNDELDARSSTSSMPRSCARGGGVPDVDHGQGDHPAAAAVQQGPARPRPGEPAGAAEDAQAKMREMFVFAQQKRTPSCAPAEQDSCWRRTRKRSRRSSWSCTSCTRRSTARAGAALRVADHRPGAAHRPTRGGARVAGAAGAGGARAADGRAAEAGEADAQVERDKELTEAMESAVHPRRSRAAMPLVWAVRRADLRSAVAAGESGI